MTRSTWAAAANDTRSDHVGKQTRRHPHITYSRGHCAFIYDDGARCVWEGELLDGMCAAHRYITKRRVGTQPAIHDATTPWGCGVDDCDDCGDRPTYREWWLAHQAQRR